MLKRLISKLTSKSAPLPSNEINLQIIPRNDHGISRTDISENALKVLYRLKKAGYEAHLVGGGVRDLLLGLHPKDFDVTTNAKPEQVHKLFKNSRLIGRRFRLVHVVFGRDVIEVATFRAGHDSAKNSNQSKQSDSGMLLRDNVYGTIDEDAMRRDFTVNALYYDIKDFSVRSYCGGIDDLNNKTMRLIGEPDARYREDPVRMLRAVRFAAKLGFGIDAPAAEPIKELAPLLKDIPAARMFEEVLKLFLAGKAKATFELMEEYNLFAQLFPHTQQCIDENPHYRKLVEQALINSDKRISQGKSLTPAFIFSVFLWPNLLETQKKNQGMGMHAADAMQQAQSDVISHQQKHTSIPKRFMIPMREIWNLQYRLEQRKPKQLENVLSHGRFRAAYDFLLLREQVGEELDGAGEFWTQYQNENPHLVQQHKRTEYKKRGPRRDGPNRGPRNDGNRSGDEGRRPPRKRKPRD